MRKLMVHPKTTALALLFFGLLLALYSLSVFAKNYPKILGNISVEMNAEQLDSIAGTPTKTNKVSCWIYNTVPVISGDRHDKTNLNLKI